MTRLASLVTVLALAACGSSPGPAPANPTAPVATAPVVTPAAAPADAGLLKLAEIRFFGRNNELGMHIYPDGRLEVAQGHFEAGKAPSHTMNVLATLAADGSVSAGGKVVGALQADGSFVSDGKPAPFQLVGTTLTANGKHVQIDEHGAVVADGEVSPDLRVEGAVDDGTRRTALLALALTLTSMEGK